MYLHYCSKSPEKRQQKIHRMQFLQHRQANESFLLPSVRCRGEAFRMGMGSPPIPLSLSRETVGGCALPRLFGAITGLSCGKPLRIYPANGSAWKLAAASPGPAKKGRMSPFPLGCETGGKPGRLVPLPSVGPGAGASPRGFPPCAAKAGSGWPEQPSAAQTGLKPPALQPF